MAAAWNILTNHGWALIFISRRPESTGLEIAQAVGITERAARTIVDDLEAEGYIERERIGRRNRYRVNGDMPLRGRGARAMAVGELLNLSGLEPDDPAALSAGVIAKAGDEGET
ncbi:MAG: winged helix-turn-helix domain-containing protein [Chloroflexi bacterium]|nr:winged helix-turn-helix domain-containing protein [Chloroflexota bacterium]